MNAHNQAISRRDGVRRNCINAMLLRNKKTAHNKSVCPASMRGRINLIKNTVDMLA